MEVSPLDLNEVSMPFLLVAKRTRAESTYVFYVNFFAGLFSKKIGGAKRDRTADLYNAIVALSQLSYSPKFSFNHFY